MNLATAPQDPLPTDDRVRALVLGYLDDHPTAMDTLDGMRDKYDEKFYYELRDSRPTGEVDQAARFLYLNKTCFNGLYRTNTKGGFNVPFGKRKRCPTLYDRANMLIAVVDVVVGPDVTTLKRQLSDAQIHPTDGANRIVSQTLGDPGR